MKSSVAPFVLGCPVLLAPATFGAEAPRPTPPISAPTQETPAAAQDRARDPAPKEASPENADELTRARAQASAASAAWTSYLRTIPAQVDDVRLDRRVLRAAALFEIVDGHMANERDRVIGICVASQGGLGYYAHHDEILAALKGDGYGWLVPP